MEFCSDTQGEYFGNSPIETSLCQSLSKTLGFGIMSVMTTRTTSLEDHVANLTKLVEGLSTSLKEKYHKIRELINKLECMNEKLECMNEGGQTSATKILQVDRFDVIEDSTIGATRNICGKTDGIFTTNQLKELIKEVITDQVKSSV